ncbi:dihydroorotate dehydrogenase [Rhodovulum adriaticum]|uniref:Dihydroorotate dehydrogenase n=1 Tax=Rhodovulum adriaticum TaxID=35804 RepID=A0A4R2NJ17_RHOAD|nr:dihydroorotate dehydrogenase [Rhodovulum adriaticum]TCP21411.1 hypothetical protein EV656_11162 [Rhodovulum adriaticum]
MTDAELDSLFEAARVSAPDPSAALLARIMDDAMAQAGARAVPDPAPAPQRRPGGSVRRRLLACVLAGLGGWPSMAGLATAGVVGIWIGYADPVGLDAVTTAMLGGGYGPADLAPSLDTFLQEG